MPFQPSQSSVHVNRPLTNISLAMLQDPGAFAALRAFHNIGVDKQSDVYYKYDRGYWNRSEVKQRAPATEVATAGWTVDATNTYLCKEFGLGKDIPDPVRANADAPLRLDSEATTFLTQQMLIFKEKEFARQYLTTGVWWRDEVGVAANPTAQQFIKWNDYTNSDPIANVREWKREMLQNTGQEPKVLMLGRDVYDVLLDHPDIVDRIKYGQQPGSNSIVTRAILAALFELDEIIVSNAIENTANEGAANVHSFIVGAGRGLLLYRPASPGLMTPAPGYHFSWRGLDGAFNDLGTTISRFRMDLKKADRIEIASAFDMKLVSGELATYISAAV